MRGNIFMTPFVMKEYIFMTNFSWKEIFSWPNLSWKEIFSWPICNERKYFHDPICHERIYFHDQFVMKGNIFMTQLQFVMKEMLSVKFGVWLWDLHVARLASLSWKMFFLPTTLIYEPWCKKTSLCDFRPGLTLTSLCSHRSRLEGWNFRVSKKRDCNIRVAKTKALMIAVQLLHSWSASSFFAYAKVCFSRNAAHTIPYLFRPDHLMIPEFRELSL